MIARAFILALLCAMASASAGHAASFDCAQAATAIEKAICADPELSRLDELADAYYRAALATLPGGAECLPADQRAWLGRVRNRCGDRSCLRTAYLNRLAELDKVQPARRPSAPVDLPVRPFLSSIIPPADRKPDPGESDPASAAPIELAGTLSEVGGAYLLRSPDGRSYALMNWYIEAAVLDQINAAILTPGARFIVRGFAGRNRASGQRYFEPRRCIYVYRAP